MLFSIRQIVSIVLVSNLQMGMVEFVGLIKVNVIRGTNLAVRDMVTSDPYVILNLGHQVSKLWNQNQVFIMLTYYEFLAMKCFGVFLSHFYCCSQ